MTRADSGDDGQGAGDEAALDNRLCGSPGDLARYISDMTTSLSRLAREAGLDLLAHLLDVAQLEAAQQSGRGRSRQPRN